MQHKYNRNYDYSDTSATIRISLDRKMKLKAYAESLCDADTGFVSMRKIIDDFLDGNRETFNDYLIWLKDNDME